LVKTVLLDTAPFLWALTDPAKLSPAARETIADGGWRIVVSAVSLWEVVIKSQKGLLPIADPAKWLETGLRALEADLLPVKPAHVYAVAGLPDIHKDPFDRMLLAQARTEGWPLVSSDSIVQQYPVAVLWKEIQ
jgi:PIN domain nuclease of toxin-antitoxin system